MKTSVIIRTLNEAQFLGDCLEAIEAQTISGDSVEVVVVDSGSTDETLVIAEQHRCRIVTIQKSEFTFGRALNIGCEAASGDYLVFLSDIVFPQAARGWRI